MHSAKTFCGLGGLVGGRSGQSGRGRLSGWGWVLIPHADFHLVPSLLGEEDSTYPRTVGMYRAAWTSQHGEVSKFSAVAFGDGEEGVLVPRAA
jgi:hypothetical protein